MKPFNSLKIKTDLRRTFLLSFVLSISVFVWLRLIFFDIPFSLPDEGFGLLKTIVIYWAIIFTVKTILNIFMFLADKFRHLPSLKWLISRIAIH